MKRIQLYIILALAVLLTVAVILWPRSRGSLSKSPETMSTITPPATNSLSVETGAVPSRPQINPEPSQQAAPQYVDTNAPEFQKLIAAVHAQSERNVAERSKPIAFYGKVVDEATQAVAGASIHFIWVDPKSTSESDTTSAADGSFSLKDKIGGDVSVYVWKTGYYEAKSLNRTTFNNTGDDSSMDNPVLFHLRKKGPGADLISSSLNVQIPRDGTPVGVDFLNRSFGGNGSMQMSQVKPPYESWKKATEWSFKMEIADGGFIEQNEEFPFEAPENGYQPTIDFNFKADQPDWKTAFTKSYYIVFGNPRRYGQLTVQTDIMWGGAKVTYTINPDGLRSLEPKDETYVRPK